uniref:Uncharacterized protein n=1 Tax=Physcomitrium patens TaxID=3218 RepID=A0A2K1IFD7_PHYPA|nr:hypothetical protein PHYPA_028588 [Physcomitrium patens]
MYKVIACPTTLAIRAAVALSATPGSSCTTDRPFLKQKFTENKVSTRRKKTTIRRQMRFEVLSTISRRKPPVQALRVVICLKIDKRPR